MNSEKLDEQIKKLMALAAALEAVMGLALIIHPALVVRLLFGGDIFGAGLALGRVCGFGLLAFGLACWPSIEATAPAVRGMLAYNLLTTAYLVYLLLAGEFIGKFLLPVIVIHSTLTFLFARAWLRHRSTEKKMKPLNKNRG